jgi:hypothetical protein
MFVTFRRYYVWYITMFLCLTHCDVWKCCHIVTSGYVCHIERRGNVHHTATRRRCATHCDACNRSLDCDITIHIGMTCLCSSNHDVNLCSSHCNVNMFNRLQHYYVHQIAMCSSHCDVWKGLSQYFK